MTRSTLSTLIRFSNTWRILFGRYARCREWRSWEGVRSKVTLSRSRTLHGLISLRRPLSGLKSASLSNGMLLVSDMDLHTLPILITFRTNPDWHTHTRRQDNAERVCFSGLFGYDNDLSQSNPFLVDPVEEACDTVYFSQSIAGLDTTAES